MLQTAIRERQQRSIQGALGVLEDGVVLVNMFHYLRIKLILLRTQVRKWAVVITSVNCWKHDFVFSQCFWTQPEGTVWVCVRLLRLTEVGSTRVTIQLWQLSKQQEGQVMTQQSTLARLTCYTLSAGVSEFTVRAFSVFRSLCGLMPSSTTDGFHATALEHLLLISNVALARALFCLCNPSNPTNPSTALQDEADFPSLSVAKLTFFSFTVKKTSLWWWHHNNTDEEKQKKHDFVNADSASWLRVKC